MQARHDMVECFRQSGYREAAAEATRAFMTCTSRVGKTTRLLALSTKLVIYLFEFTGHWPATESFYTAIEHGDRNLCALSIRSSAEGYNCAFPAGALCQHAHLLLQNQNRPSTRPAVAFHDFARSTDSRCSGCNISLSIRSLRTGRTSARGIAAIEFVGVMLKIALARSGHAILLTFETCLANRSLRSRL